jgi:Transposase DDE domain/Transposase domain (DUF772)
VPQRSTVVRWRGALEGLLPPDHLARFVWRVVSTLDFSDLEVGYRSVQGGPGRSPYHPRLLAALWIYGMTQGIETAAAIAQACRVRDDFRWLTGGLCPSDQTLLNLVAGAPAGLSSIWVHLLEAMHCAGHLDLSALVEDGTKLRANASPRSFHTAAELTDIVQDRARQLATKLERLGEQAQQPPHRAKLRALAGRLERATRAATELQHRADRRRPDPAGPRGGEAVAPADSGASGPPGPARPKFGRADFRHDAERDVLICPAGKPLRLLGIYCEPPRSRYRLYGAQDCRDCGLKAQCTGGPRRRVKIPIDKPTQPADPLSSPASPNPAGGAHAVASDPPATETSPPPSGPRASITEPEAVMMLATSEKRWAPSYNADLTVTRHGIIVSQFLTKDTTDYAHFARALPAVLSTLGRPEAWVGDGHYGTQENVQLAHRAGVVLYAPLAGPGPDAAPAPSPGSADSGTPDGAAAQGNAPPRKFCSRDFRLDPDRNVLICPAGQELRLLGVYAEPQRAAYRIYGRANCEPCSLKARCTEARGRRVKLPVAPAARRPSPNTPTEGEANAAPSSGPTASPGEVTQLVDALAARMRELGDRLMRFRHTTIEPVNAQLKQHGLGRFHVHGVARCSTVLTLACVAHNLMKWKAREATRALKAVA